MQQYALLAGAGVAFGRWSLHLAPTSSCRRSSRCRRSRSSSRRSSCTPRGRRPRRPAGVRTAGQLHAGRAGPLSLQRPAWVAVMPVQVGACTGCPRVDAAGRLAVAHPVGAAGGRALSAHWPSGSEPSGTLVQSPSLPGTAHDRQVPVQVDAQQTPLLAEAGVALGGAAARGADRLLAAAAVDARVRRDAVRVAHADRQAAGLAQMYGWQEWPGVVIAGAAGRSGKPTSASIRCTPLLADRAGRVLVALPGAVAHAGRAAGGRRLDRALVRGSVPSCAVMQVPTVPWRRRSCRWRCRRRCSTRRPRRSRWRNRPPSRTRCQAACPALRGRRRPDN